jgi:hypothetical protein
LPDSSTATGLHPEAHNPALLHLIVFQESSLRRTLVSYFDYYHRSRTHLALGKDSPTHDPFSRRESGQSRRCPRSEDCTTATSDGPPETAALCRATSARPFEISVRTALTSTPAPVPLRISFHQTSTLERLRD